MMFKALKGSLRNSLLLFIFLCVFLPTLIISIYGYVYYSGNKIENTFDDLTALNGARTEQLLEKMQSSAAAAESFTKLPSVRSMTENFNNAVSSSIMSLSSSGTDGSAEAAEAAETEIELPEISAADSDIKHYMRNLLMETGFADMYVATKAGGYIAHAVHNSDLIGTSLESQRIPGLAGVWERVLSSGSISMIDFPSNVSESELTMYLGIPVRSPRGDTVGVFIFSITPEFLNSVTLIKDGMYDSRETFVLNHEGSVISARTNEGPMTGTVYDHTQMESAVRGDADTAQISEPETGNRIMVSYRPLSLAAVQGIGNDLQWSVITQLDRDEIMAQVRAFLRMVIYGIIFFFIAALAAGYIISQKIVSPITELTGHVSKLAEGYLDFTGDTSLENEIGTLYKTTRVMAEKTKAIVLSVDTTIKKANTQASTISSGVEEQSAILAEQAGSVTEISSTMDEFTTSLTQVTDNINSVSEMTERMLVHITEDSNLTNAVAEKIKDIDQANKKNISEIMELRKRSKDITKIMEIINNIADQTKIIAFNAALEASSAGEAGKRFGVVASEIRKLADSVTSSTANIENIISEIQQSADHMVIASESTTKNIQEGLEFSGQSVKNGEKIVEQVKTSNEAARQITLSIQQQKTAAEQIQSGLKELSDGANQNSEAIQSISEIGNELLEISEQLESLMKQFKLDS